MAEEGAGGFDDSENEIGQIIRRERTKGGGRPHVSPQHTEMVREATTTVNSMALTRRRFTRR